MQVWHVLHTARWKYGMQKVAKNLPSGHHHTSLSGCMFASKACGDNRKKLNSNTSSTCPHNMAYFGPLTAEIGSGVWGNPANFNGFRVLASLLQRHHSSETNKTLHDVWPSPGLLHQIYIFGDYGILPGAKFTLRPKSCVVLYWQRHCMTLQQWTSAKHCGVVQGMELRSFCRGWHLYSAGWPSRWASAHILVFDMFLFYYSTPQCYCKCCTSYGNSVCLSVCTSVRLYICPSVTRWYCVKTMARSTVQSALSHSKTCLVINAITNSIHY